MPDPCRERIVAAIEAALGGIAGIAGLAIERDRSDDIAAADMPRLVVFEGGEEDATAFSGEQAFDLQIDVEGYVDGATMAAANAAAATLRAKMDAAMFADVTLGGLTRDLRLAEEAPPSRLDFISARPAKGVSRAYVVTYATVEGDPFTFA